MINWTVNSTRKEILNDSSRFKVIVAGRRWGKTVLSLMYLLKEGVALTRCVMDEMAYIKPNVWEEIVYPMLATTQGEVLFIGTPSGYDMMYELYSKGQSEKDWRSWQFKTIDGGFVPKEEIERAKRSMDEVIFRQEFEGSFETTGNRAAYNFERELHCIKTKELSNNLWWGVDFNVDFMTAVLACQYTDGTIHFFNELRLKNSNTEELSIEMKKIAPNIECYPDPAGKARSTTSRRSDHQILRDHGFSIRAKNSHPSHIDRLNALNRKLKDAEGKVGMTVEPSCRFLVKDLEQCQRDKRGGLDKTQMDLTHALDACSYAIAHKFPIRRLIGKSIDW